MGKVVFQKRINSGVNRGGARTVSELFYNDFFVNTAL